MAEKGKGKYKGKGVGDKGKGKCKGKVEGEKGNGKNKGEKGTLGMPNADPADSTLPPNARMPPALNKIPKKDITASASTAWLEPTEEPKEDPKEDPKELDGFAAAERPPPPPPGGPLLGTVAPPPPPPDSERRPSRTP